MKKLNITDFSIFLDDDRKVIFLQIREKIDINKSRIYRIILNHAMWNEIEVEDSIKNPLNMEEFYSK